MEKNITVICLVNGFKKRIAKALADELDMMYADCNDVMEFNLINTDMINIVGQDYFDKNESKTLEMLCGYENTVLTINFSTLNKKNNINAINNSCLIVYLKMKFDLFVELNKMEVLGTLNKINEIAFKDRDALMTNISDVQVDIDEIDSQTVIKNILKEIESYYDKKLR